MRPAKLCTRTPKSFVLTAAFLVLVPALSGCTVRPAQSPDERLRNQAAEDAKQVHHDLRAAGTEAKHALVDARRETKDIVAGAREGWAESSGPKHDKSGDGTGTVDLNHASAAELEVLPGIEARTARRIEAARPYSNPDELWKHHLVTRAEFDRIADRLTAK